MKIKLKSKAKKVWIDIHPKDFNFWLGQYLMAAMVIHAYNEKDGVPDRIGKIGDMINQKDKTGLLPYQAEWNRKEI